MLRNLKEDTVVYGYPISNQCKLSKHMEINVFKDGTNGYIFTVPGGVIFEISEKEYNRLIGISC